MTTKHIKPADIKKAANEGEKRKEKKRSDRTTLKQAGVNTAIQTNSHSATLKAHKGTYRQSYKEH